MKSSQRHLYSLILTLFIIGIGIFLYRHFVLDVPFTNNETVNSWVIEANLRFKAEPNLPVKASFSIPYMPPNFNILDEYFVAQHYGIATNLEGDNRRVVWSLRRSHGSQSLYYRAIVRETSLHESFLAKPIRFKTISLENSKKAAIEAIINQARQSSADIQTFTQSTINELNKKDGNARLLIGNNSDDKEWINAIITVLQQAKIHALSIQGTYLAQKNKASFQRLLAVYNNSEWIYINPRSGAIGLPKDFLIWQYGDEPLFHVAGGKQAQLTLTITSAPINALSVAKMHGLQTESQLLRFSLLQLPVNVQETYKILLTIPIGAFIILILRNFIGLKTFGTFMPVLIALAFRETHVVWGIILFTLIVSFGLLARFYLDQLRLLLVPRLSAILTIVILLMIFISVVSQNLGLDSGLSVALFPMVILTMTIERMCVTWDERGAYEAIKSGVGSLLAAVIAFAAMNNAPLQYLMFAFPELLLVLLAIILFFGQYRGYRFMELFRFNVLGGR